MEANPHIKSSSRAISTITSNEDDIRLRIYTGEIPLWEAAKARFDYMWSGLPTIEKERRITFRVLVLENKRLRGMIHDAYKQIEATGKDQGILVAKIKKGGEDRSLLFRGLGRTYKELEATKKEHSYYKDWYIRQKESILSLYKSYIDIRDSNLKKDIELRNLQKELSMLREEKEQEVTDDNVIDLAKHVADKHKATDSAIPETNWLNNLPVGAVFTCITANPADRNPMAMEWHVIHKCEKSIQLLSNLNEPEVYTWVEPFRFCSAYRLLDVLNNDE